MFSVGNAAFLIKNVHQREGNLALNLSLFTLPQTFILEGVFRQKYVFSDIAAGTYPFLPSTFDNWQSYLLLCPNRSVYTFHSLLYYSVGMYVSVTMTWHDIIIYNCIWCHIVRISSAVNCSPLTLADMKPYYTPMQK